MKAVVWTDTFQMLVLVGGLITMLVIGLDKTGGYDKIMDKADDGKRLNWDE